MFDNLDDPQKQMLLMLGAGLLSPTRNKGMTGFGEAMGKAIPQGLLGYSSATEAKRRNAMADMQAKFQQAQLGQMEQSQADEAFKRSIAPQYFNPGNAPSDGMGPVSPPKMDVAGYGAALAQRSPEMGLPFLPKPQQPKMGFAPNGEAVDMNALPVGKSFAAPSKPAFQPGQTREIKSGRTIYTQEFQPDGSWKQIGKSAIDAPDKPDKGPGAPQGYRWSGDKLEPIPGGPADAKVGKEADALQKRQAGAMERADFVLGKVGEAIKDTGFTTAGPLGAVGRNIPGTGAYNLNKTIDSIKANIGFAELQAMREASPTGGALGQVAVQELNMLQSVLGSLDTAQSPQQLEKSLYAIEKHYQGWKRAVKGAQPDQGPNVDDLVKKYGGG
jgi:hypothetical protein